MTVVYVTYYESEAHYVNRDDEDLTTPSEYASFAVLPPRGSHCIIGRGVLAALGERRYVVADVLYAGAQYGMQEVAAYLDVYPEVEAL